MSNYNTDIGAAIPKSKVDADTEAHVKQVIEEAINATLAIKNPCVANARGEISHHACHGIINGAAIEVIRRLGMEPSFINLEDRS